MELRPPHKVGIFKDLYLLYLCCKVGCFFLSFSFFFKSSTSLGKWQASLSIWAWDLGSWNSLPWKCITIGILGFGVQIYTSCLVQNPPGEKQHRNRPKDNDTPGGTGYKQTLNHSWFQYRPDKSLQANPCLTFLTIQNYKTSKK